MDVRLTCRRRDHDIHRFVLHVWRTSGHRRYAWESYQSEATERRRNGVRAVRRLIAESIRLLTNHPSTSSLCRVPERRAIGKNIFNILCGRSHPYPCTSLSTLLAISCLLRLHTRAVPHLRIKLNSNHDFSVNRNLFDWHGPVGGHTEKRLYDLIGVHIFLSCKFEVVCSTNDRMQRGLFRLNSQ